MAPRIYELAEERLPITLTVSLHAPNDKIRNEIMPVNHIYNIGELLKACRAYYKAAGRRISFEYSLIAGVNDSPECARELAALVRDIHGHVNLIPVNPVEEREYRSGSRREAERFCKILADNGINATIRRTLGADISASCGQLRKKVL